MSRQKWLQFRRSMPFIVVGSLLFLAVVYFVGYTLSKPALRDVSPAPDYPPFRPVSFSSESGSQLQGWFATHSDRAGGVVLIHGLRADRRNMINRAEFIYEAGYSVLIFDLQAHGESSGTMITFGFLEALDARAAVTFLRKQLPDEPLAAIGTSLGGAACILGPHPIDVDALILEAVYPNIRKAVKNRLRLKLGWAGIVLEPLLTFQLKLKAGIKLEDLRPAESISMIKTPVLIMAGEVDQRTTLADSQLLFNAAPEPKDFWVLAGAAHIDFHRHAALEYEKRVLRFLRRHLHEKANTE